MRLLRKRARLWGGLYCGLVGTPDDDAETDGH
jgi:hypothetical protein